MIIYGCLSGQYVKREMGGGGARRNDSKTTEPHSLLSTRGNKSYSTVGHTDLLVCETVAQQSHGN